MPDMTRKEAEGCWNRIYAHGDSMKAELVDLYRRKGWLALGFRNWNAMMTAKVPGKSQSTYYNMLSAALDTQELLDAGQDIEPEFSRILESMPASHLDTLRCLPDIEARKTAIQLAYATAPQILVSGKPTAALMEEAVNVVKEIIDQEGVVELDEGMFAAQAKVVLAHHERVQEHIDRNMVRKSKNGKGRKNESVSVVNLAHARISTVFQTTNQVTFQFENSDDAKTLFQCYHLGQGKDLIVSIVRKGEKETVRSL